MAQTSVKSEEARAVAIPRLRKLENLAHSPHFLASLTSMFGAALTPDDEGAMMDDPESRPLTLPQVAEIAEVEYARLHSWVKKGLLSASILASTGTGSPNLFSTQDAEKARILADLSRAGVEFSSLEEAATKIGHRGVPDGDLYLSVNGSVEFLEPSTRLSDFKDPAIVYPLRLARKATQDAVS